MTARILLIPRKTRGHRPRLQDSYASDAAKAYGRSAGQPLSKGFFGSAVI
jgi:hypothetical protein